MVEVIVRDQPGLGAMEFDVERFASPNFKFTDMCGTVTNTGRPCVQEGGFRDRRNYEIWRWSTIKWLRNLIEDQIEFEESSYVVIVQPSMKGYCLHIEGTDVYYEMQLVSRSVDDPRAS